MRFDKLENLVGDLPELPNVLTVLGSGQVRYESHSNASRSDAGIGSFATSLAAGEVQALANELDNPPFRDLPDHWGRVRSGEHYRRIRVTAGSQVTEKFTGSKLPVAPTFRRLTDRLDQIVAESINHPQQTLWMEFTQPKVGAERELAGELTLSARGSEPAVCRSPADLLAAPDGWLSIHGWLEGPDDREVSVVRVNRADDLRFLGGARSDPPILVIPPGGSVTCRIWAPLPARLSGACIFRVAWVSFAEKGGDHRLLTGELLSKTTKVGVPLQGERVPAGHRNSGGNE